MNEHRDWMGLLNWTPIMNRADVIVFENGSAQLLNVIRGYLPSFWSHKLQAVVYHQLLFNTDEDRRDIWVYNMTKAKIMHVR